MRQDTAQGNEQHKRCRRQPPAAHQCNARNITCPCKLPPPDSMPHAYGCRRTDCLRHHVNHAADIQHNLLRGNIVFAQVGYQPHGKRKQADFQKIRQPDCPTQLQDVFLRTQVRQGETFRQPERAEIRASGKIGSQRGRAEPEHDGGRNASTRAAHSGNGQRTQPGDNAWGSLKTRR